MSAAERERVRREFERTHGHRPVAVPPRPSVMFSSGLTDIQMEVKTKFEAEVVEIRPGTRARVKLRVFGPGPELPPVEIPWLYEGDRTEVVLDLTLAPTPPPPSPARPSLITRLRRRWTN